ncbi:MAG: YceD family protein, partial [Candidatus Binatia bacterium]
MKILVSQITESPKELSFAEATEELNRLYSAEARDFSFPQSLDVRVVYYRSGPELFFQGRIGGTVEGHCSRCLKVYSFLLTKEFDFVLAPDTRSPKTKELNQDELGLS